MFFTCILTTHACSCEWRQQNEGRLVAEDDEQKHLLQKHGFANILYPVIRFPFSSSLILLHFFQMITYRFIRKQGLISLIGHHAWFPKPCDGTSIVFVHLQTYLCMWKQSHDHSLCCSIGWFVPLLKYFDAALLMVRSCRYYCLHTHVSCWSKMHGLCMSLLWAVFLCRGLFWGWPQRSLRLHESHC